MWLLLLALADGTPPQEARAALQSCEMTPSGWVCTYKMPPITLIGTPEGGTTTAAPPATVTVPQGVAASLPVIPPRTDAEVREEARRARLIAKCYQPGWLSLCLPGERKEAKVLKAEADSRAQLRARVTSLLAESRCEAAIKAALEGGDLALAREARTFCTR